MKIIKLKDRLLDILCMRLECWVHKHDPYLTTVVASSFLTVTFIGMLFLLLFLACKQVYPNEGAVDRQSCGSGLGGCRALCLPGYPRHDA